MRVYLIRHGETVDNVAGLYAGVRDSGLTNHGYLQASRLAQYFKTQTITLSTVFCSHLQRARKTAELLAAAQSEFLQDEGQAPLKVTCLPMLAEKDFGSFEGKAYAPRAQDTKREKYPEEHSPDFKAPETKDAMNRRMDKFIDDHLLPHLVPMVTAQDASIAIVSHGLIMAVLWRRLLARVPGASIIVGPGVASNRSYATLDHLPSWSNTGYLELDLQSSEQLSSSSNRLCESAAERHSCSMSQSTVETPRESTTLSLCGISVISVNKTDHLRGIKRTGGGVGSSKHDAGQRTIEGFFKKRKVV